ncbi:amidophosphoribosyltransferase [Algoriphagus kandeliae]|uniref:Amidophosphoribosyltransferase n=1 Tax=Algoriphagus kandeliae TaxID=2562278 RepID=A0A4Y9R1H5_9BACT|nr:alanine racemase [Algoriphagus kandeliae]TFV97383.1 amidophosphoribosyltransferase [Algoriphagus kandeliae]
MDYRSQITSPTLLIDEKICRANIQKMAEKAELHQLELIPHWKTAQSKKIGEWAREYGIRKITASSIRQAAYLSNSGWELIHIAFPFNIREIPLLNKLAKTQPISVQIVNTYTIQELAKNLTSPVGFMIEIDAGYGRTGVHMSDFAKIDEILQIASTSEHLSFFGFYIHPGHTYYKPDKELIYHETRQALAMLKTKYESQYPNLVTRIGDTPGCSVATDFGDIDQMGPGNFVFYDLMQVELGSCKKSDIAVALAVPVVDIVPERNEILVHGGGVHLAKDHLIEVDGRKNFGEIVILKEDGWEIPESRSFVKSISQEHGLIQASEELLNQVQVGDLLGILPVHSCMTADAMGAYLSLSGEWIDHAEEKKFKV